MVDFFINSLKGKENWFSIALSYIIVGGSLALLAYHIFILVLINNYLCR